MQYHHRYIVDLHNINDKIDFIITNASMSLRSIFFNDDYRSTIDENWIKTFSFFFFTLNQDLNRHNICSAWNVVIWNEQKDINDQDHTNKSSHQDTRVKKKKKRRSITAHETSLFFFWRIFRRKSINTFIHSTRVACLFISFFFEWIVEKNSQSNRDNFAIIWNCWFISTMMIRFKSVYCMSVVYWLMMIRLLIKLSTMWSICRCVGHMTHANLMRSG
jgi:hypothetical protein